jgi:glycosyltransferase involved in cell wall biosynthesis
VNLLPSKNVFIEGRLHFEGFGLVHLESIKLGTPSIGCLNTGNESFISDDINGCLINQDDLSGLITATRKLLLLTDKKDFNINVKESVKSFNSEFYRNEIKKIYGI